MDVTVNFVDPQVQKFGVRNVSTKYFAYPAMTCIIDTQKEWIILEKYFHILKNTLDVIDNERIRLFPGAGLYSPDSETTTTTQKCRFFNSSTTTPTT